MVVDGVAVLYELRRQRIRGVPKTITIAVLTGYWTTSFSAEVA